MRKKKRRGGGAQTIAGLAGLRGHKKLRTCVRRWPGSENARNGPRKHIWHPQNQRHILSQLTIKVSIEKFFSLKFFYIMSRPPTVISIADQDDDEPQASTSRPTSRPTSRTTTSRPSSRPTSGTARSSTPGARSLTEAELEEIQTADTQPFNSESDEDYLEIARELDMTEEDKKLFKEVNVQSSELATFIGSEVIITMKGDQRDHPSIYGVVRGVNDEVMLLMPAKVDEIKIPKTTINISDISKCSTVPEEWDQHVTGPVQYVAPKVITPIDKPIKVDEQQILHQKSRHKRHKSEGRINLDESHRSDPEQNRSHSSVGIRHKYRPLEIKTIQPISRQEEMQPRLVRTDSIYPNLEGLLPFNLVVKGTSKDPDYIKVEEGHSQGQEEEVQHSQDPEPRTDQEKIDQRKSHWLSHFLVEYYRETTSATMEGRIANLYKAAEKAAQISLLQIQRTVLYKFKFNPDYQVPATTIATQLWNHFESYGFELSIGTSTFKCKEPSKPYMHPETRQYIGHQPECKRQYNIEPKFTHSGDLDCFYLRKKFETSRSKLTFVCWLRSAKIPQILILNKVELALPSTFSLLTNENLRIFFIQQWEQSFQMRDITFDEWFDDIGYTIRLPKSSPENHDELKRFRLPTWPLTMQEQYEMQVLEQQRQKEEQQKDTVKIVERRTTRSDEEDAPGRITRGMAYATQNRHKYPGIQEALEKWIQNDEGMEFEDHFHNQTLPATLPTTKEAWQRYRSKSLSSSQEDSLAKHMANINLSSSTTKETKQRRSYHSKHPESYEKCFGAAAILQPASTHDFLMTALHVQANYKMTKNIWPALMAISPNDFRPQGRFAHIFIPKYVYVPKEIFAYLGLTSTKTTPLYHLTWQFCYAARQEAGKWVTQEDVEDSVSHWNDILQNTHGLNNMNLSLIDVVQAQAARKWYAVTCQEEKDPYVWYDMFIRPTEPLFARKTLLNEKLTLAFKCQNHTKEFFKMVCNLVNIPHDDIPLTAVECVEEMSKIRHLPARALIQITEMDPPVSQCNKVRLEPNSFSRIWDSFCEADRPTSTTSSGRGSLQSEALDVSQSYLDIRIDECQNEMQQTRELRRKTNDFLLNAERQRSPIFGQQPTSQKELERQYYHTRLQFFDIRMQMLQEELDLLHNQRDYLMKEHKDLWQMTAQEIDEVIKDLFKQQHQVEEIRHKYDTLIAETPDTDENTQIRSQYQYSLRLAQVRLQSIDESIEEARRQKHCNQTMSPPQVKRPPRPQSESYPSSVFHKEVPRKPMGVPWDQAATIPIYSTEPIEVEDRRKKIHPSLPTYGYVSRQEKLHKSVVTRKPQRVYQVEEAPEWTNLPLSATEYVNRGYPQVPSNDAKITSEPLYRKFNMDGLNDYCQMVIKTSHHKQHEILLMMAYIGRPEGWETMSNPIHIPIALSADFIERIQLACNTKLPPACKDKVHPKACLFNTTLDKARLIIDISIRPEKGPHGEERIVTINKHQKHQQALDHTIKVPWIQLPKMLQMLNSVMSEYEYTPVDLQSS